MSAIVIEQGFRPGFCREELQALAESIQGRVPGHDVEIDWYQHDPDIRYSLGPLTIEAITTNVPWEALTGAAATVFLEVVRDWVADRYKARKVTREAEAEKAKRGVRETPNFQPPVEKWESLIKPTTPLPQQVRIYGPKGEMLGIVHQDSGLNQPSIMIGKAAIEHDERWRTLPHWARDVTCPQSLVHAL